MNRDKVQVGDIVPAAPGVIVVAPQDGMDDKHLAAGELQVFNCAGGRDALPGGESRNLSETRALARGRASFHPPDNLVLGSGHFRPK